ncbi:hypothetical protein ACFYV5_09965 [Streptomyces sp. NPDC003035]|uniref:hypothetical protein n=1 Tax=Streptomyces sp. NPDC003035 TaxID=3364676 RepID=UPI00367AD727
MSGQLTDRDERIWQLRAEERVARPLPIGAWIRRLGAVVVAQVAAHRAETGGRAPMAAARPRPARPCEPA